MPVSTPHTSAAADDTAAVAGHSSWLLYLRRGSDGKIGPDAVSSGACPVPGSLPAPGLLFYGLGFGLWGPGLGFRC
jgi:hypothetical protein